MAGTLGFHVRLSAQSVSTAPLGMVGIAVPKVSVNAPVYFYLGIPLAPPAVYKGRFSAMSSDRLTDAAAVWADNAFNPSSADAERTHYIEITSGAFEGVRCDIRATSTDILTVDFTFGTGSVIGANYVIRRHRTLGDFFGPSNESGLRGGTAAQADIVSLWSGASYREYFYSIPTAGEPGWRKVGEPVADRANVPIYPEEGIFIKFIDGNAPAFRVLGEVLVGSPLVAVLPGFNLMNPMTPVDLTLGLSNLYTGNAATGLKPGAPTTADIVSIYNGASFDDYYYRATAAGPVGWRKAGDVATDRSTVAIPAGAAFVIKRKEGQTPFLWKRPTIYTP